MDAFWKQYHPWMLVEPFSQCSHQVLNAYSDGVFKENVWWRNTILFKRRLKDCDLVITSENLAYFHVQDWKNISARFYHLPNANILLWGTKSDAPNIVYERRTNWKFIFPWKKTNEEVLQLAKAHFRYTEIHIWFEISEKSIIRYTFLYRGGGAGMHPKS